MMNRITQNTAAAAIELQNAAAQRYSQAAGAQTAQQAGAQYNFAEIFGGGVAGTAPQPAVPSATHAPSSFDTAIAAATARVIKEDTGEPQSPTIQSTEETKPQTITQGVAADDTTPANTLDSTGADPGVGALVSAIMNGSFQAAYVTNPAQLQEITPAGTDYMPNFAYASDQTAAQLAQLLGGTVVQKPAFGQVNGWEEPLANFVQLPNGQTFNAADVAYFATCSNQGAAQLTADITATINEGAAWTHYYQNGGPMPFFPEGYVGPPISGMTYSASMIGADGNVINPAV